MSVLEQFEPKVIWKHFHEITQIPRPSAKEQKAREWVLAKAKKKGLEVVEDKVGNIVIRKPAYKGRENAPTVVLQGHLDMVCEKNESVAHDFDKDPIKVVQKGEWLYADGTTLGADNGIGVAAALAVMESNDILFTIRSDDSSRIADVVRWLGGSNVMLSRPQPSPVFDAGMTITSTRAMFPIVCSGCFL